MPGVWEGLFVQALRLIDDISLRGKADPFWTFGGGTVLMLRHGHRRSKDVDIFLPDPQYLGFVTPRLSEIAESITGDYVEAAAYVKLLLPQGEIDFVAAPNLTQPGHEEWEMFGRKVRVETSVEIIAKKMWHRGDRVTARDLFDLSLVAQKEPQQLARAAPFITRHRNTFLEQLQTRQATLRLSFAEIDALDFPKSYDQCVVIAERFLSRLPG